MADLIDRGKFLDNLNDEFEMGVTDAIEAVNNALDSTPAVEAEPVRHGHWEMDEEGNCKCTACGEWQSYPERYCPYCGAKMDEAITGQPAEEFDNKGPSGLLEE